MVILNGGGGGCIVHYRNACACALCILITILQRACRRCRTTPEILIKMKIGFLHSEV